MRQVPNWDEYFMSLAETTATRSKDPDRQVGCVLIDPVSKTLRSAGYNGMVRGVKETDILWQRPTKYRYVCHAEANAITTAARYGVSIIGCALYVTCFPCMSCAKLLIQSGIREVWIKSGEVSSEYKAEMETIIGLFEECGISLMSRNITNAN